MTKPDEFSPGGSKILRYEAPQERDWQPAAASPYGEEVERHFAAHFGEPSTVLHEIVSDLVHLDVHVIRPRPERNCWTLFTTGMSDLPMTVPRGAEAHKHAELILSLPPEWKVDELKVTPPPGDLEQWYWPIRWLKQLARFPHEYKTWLGMGHTMPNGDPPAPFAPQTRLCGWWLLPPITVPEEARTVKVSDGNEVQLLSMHALYVQEQTLKLVKGSDALIDLFSEADVSEVLTLDRAPVVRKKLFGLF
jgi:hypothetical protein